MALAIIGKSQWTGHQATDDRVHQSRLYNSESVGGCEPDQNECLPSNIVVEREIALTSITSLDGDPTLNNFDFLNSA